MSNSRYRRDSHLALAAYNAGPGNVDLWQEQGRGLPGPEVVDMFAFDETNDYVSNVLHWVLTNTYVRRRRRCPRMTRIGANGGQKAGTRVLLDVSGIGAPSRRGTRTGKKLGSETCLAPRLLPCPCRATLRPQRGK